MKASYGQVLLVDNGGFFPITDHHEDVALFMMDGMNLLGTGAVGVGEFDLRYGLSFLRENAMAKQVPLVCANLMYASTSEPVFDPSRIVQVGDVKVGVFGLITDRGNYGPSADSLKVEVPADAAERTVKDLRAKGADVVVLLSQLGKVESEDLVVAIDGIDAVIVGRNTPLLRKGRMIKTTVACYGGEQGQNLGRTILTLDAKKRMTTGSNDVYRLGPEVPDKKEILTLVQAFEEGFNEKMRKVEKEMQAERAQASADDSPDRFLGAELCQRCHSDEYAQWKTTSHSIAWQTLVDTNQETSSDCVPCHVVGYKEPGGFHNQFTTPDRSNVQCENCHGMGTEHHAFAENPAGVTEAVCITCHTDDQDPEWNWATRLPKILHTNYSGETIKNKKNTMDKAH